MSANRVRAPLTVALIVATVGNAAALRGQTPAGESARPAPRVVLVCEHGTVKSLVALEYFTRFAAARGLNVQAISRGTNPDADVPPIVRNGLAGDGFNIAAFRPLRFGPGDIDSSLFVVALDAPVDSIVARRVPVLRWDGLPSVMADYAGARTAISARVQRLVDSLATVKPRP